MISFGTLFAFEKSIAERSERPCERPVRMDGFFTG